jgi:hypothetical protein
VFFDDHVEDRDQLAARLADFEAVLLMRGRTAMGADLHCPPAQRLPKLKLLVTVGMWKAAIDCAAAKAWGYRRLRHRRRRAHATPALT